MNECWEKYFAPVWDGRVRLTVGKCDIALSRCFMSARHGELQAAVTNLPLSQYETPPTGESIIKHGCAIATSWHSGRYDDSQQCFIVIGKRDYVYIGVMGPRVLLLE